MVFRVRLDTIILSAEERRAINAQLGESGWADRNRCKQFLVNAIEDALCDVVLDLDKEDVVYVGP